MFSNNFILKDINQDTQSNGLLEYVLPSEDLEDLKLIKDNIKPKIITIGNITVTKLGIKYIDR